MEPVPPSQIEINRWKRFHQPEPNGCIRWMGSFWRDGYPRFKFRNVSVGAHRFAVLVKTGRMPEVAMHACDHPWCVNPDHLHAATREENMEDMRRKGRATGGVKVASVKVDERSARLILACKTFGDVQWLSREIGIPLKVCRNIFHRKVPSLKGIEVTEQDAADARQLIETAMEKAEGR